MSDSIRDDSGAIAFALVGSMPSVLQPASEIAATSAAEASSDRTSGPCFKRDTPQPLNRKPNSPSFDRKIDILEGARIARSQADKVRPD